MLIISPNTWLNSEEKTTQWLKIGENMVNKASDIIICSAFDNNLFSSAGNLWQLQNNNNYTKPVFELFHKVSKLSVL